MSVGEHGLIGKQNMYDHSVRVPLMVVGPNIPKGKKIEDDIYMQDIMATALEIAGVEKPEYIEFNSFLNRAKGANSVKRKAIYGTYQKESQRMIRKDGYKLILYPKSKTVLLYNLEKDPNELNNLAADSNYKEKIKTLFKELVELQKNMGDQLDLNAVFANHGV